MAQQLAAHLAAVRVLRREFHETRAGFGSIFALKYTRLLSMKLSCWRLCDFGSQIGWCPPTRLTVRLMTVRRASSGGDGAKYVAPDESVALSCRATYLDR